MVNKILIGLGSVVVLGILSFFLFNPLEKLREARDSARTKELISLKKAIDTYISNNAKEIAAVSSPLCSKCTTSETFFSYRKVRVNDQETVERSSLYVNSNGWIPLDFSLNSKIGQTPLKLLLIDPLEKGYTTRSKLPFFSQDEDFVYTYTAGNADKYKLTAKMESKKGLEGAKNDGGSIENRIEIGTDLNLKP